MASKYRSKTYGRTWLAYSLAAFNGSPHADHQSAQHFINSWIRKKEAAYDRVAADAVKSDMDWALSEVSRFVKTEDLADKITRDV